MGGKRIYTLFGIVYVGSITEFGDCGTSSFKLQVSLYDTSSRAATIQILHGCLNCARPADLGYEGIWLGRRYFR